MNESNVNQYSKHMHLIPRFFENYFESKGWKLTFVNLTKRKKSHPLDNFQLDEKFLFFCSVLMIRMRGNWSARYHVRSFSFSSSPQGKKFNVLLQNFIIAFFVAWKISIFNVWMNLSEQAAAENEGGNEIDIKLLENALTNWMLLAFFCMP